MMEKPWETEPNEQTFTYRGLECRVWRHPEFGTLNGYVEFPEDHPLNLSTEDSDSFNVHGGITFEGYIGGKYFLGFDCGHAWDVMPYANFPVEVMGEEATYKDMDYVVGEIKSLADQILERYNEAER